MKLYEDLPEAMINNNNFPQRFIFKPKKSSPVLPHIQSSKKSVEEELIFNAEEGLKNKMENFILKKNKKLRESSVKELYSKRLSHELNIIKNMKYSSYFLIVSDYIKWAKKKFNSCRSRKRIRSRIVGGLLFGYYRSGSVRI